MVTDSDVGPRARQGQAEWQKADELTRGGPSSRPAADGLSPVCRRAAAAAESLRLPPSAAGWLSPPLLCGWPVGPQPQTTQIMIYLDTCDKDHASHAEYRSPGRSQGVMRASGS